jgi:hypothetical protein
VTIPMVCLINNVLIHALRFLIHYLVVARGDKLLDA